MQYAVIKAGGKQHKVSLGDVIELNKINFDGKKTITFDEVLLSVNEGKVSMGKPTVAGAKVEASLVEEKRGDKIRVMKFKAKSRYRKTTGFRADLSVVKIEKIDFGGAKSETKADKPIKTAPKTEKA